MTTAMQAKLETAKQYLKERGITRPRVQIGSNVPFSPKHYPMTNFMYALQGAWLRS